jgi:prefoldin beta subunit
MFQNNRRVVSDTKMAKKEIDEETAKQIQELQFLEQNLQNFLLQKQAFMFEKNETENALEELKKSEDDVYRIIGQIMIKSKKNAVEKDLKHKKDILDLRIKSIEKQEESIKEQLTKKRDEVMAKLK